MPTLRAASRAWDRSREAIAVTVVYCPSCMAGMTFLRPMAAVLSTPQRNFLDMATIIKLPARAGPPDHPLLLGEGRNVSNTNVVRRGLKFALLFRSTWLFFSQPPIERSSL